MQGRQVSSTTRRRQSSSRLIGRSWGRRILALACAVLGVLAALPAAASASFPWTNQAEMRYEEGEVRTSFIIETTPGKVIPRHLFLIQPYLDFYRSFGFDRNFFTWGREDSVDSTYMAKHTWTGCGGEIATRQVAVPGSWSHCRPAAVKLDPTANQMLYDVHEGPLTGFVAGDTFVSDICGNWSPANAADKPSPMPTISGVKYEDLNANGARDAGEPGLSGWTIKLYFDGSYVTSTTTGAGGAYSFRLDAEAHPQLGEGKYTLKEESRSGWRQEEKPGTTFVEYGVGNRKYPGNDFGNWRPATISGHKFDDSDVDGVWGSSEKALSSWGIGLSSGDEALTGAEGGYSFSVRPGTYAVAEEVREGWRQTAPGGPGTFERTVISGQKVEGLDFGNVCLGGIDVEPVDDSTGEPVAGLEVRLEEESVPELLENEPPLPREAETTDAAEFGDLLPGVYRVTVFLPDGVFTTDPDTALVDGRFAIVKQVTVGECATTGRPIHVFTESTPGKVTGGELRIELPGGFATGGFVFMAPGGEPRGVLQYHDHVAGLNLHTDRIEGIRIVGEDAWIWGRVEYEGASQRFDLHVTDAGEPGTEDRFELMVTPDYEAGQGETLTGGNVQIHF